jgi:hypothetical protein
MPSVGILRAFDSVFAQANWFTVPVCHFPLPRRLGRGPFRSTDRSVVARPDDPDREPSQVRRIKDQ